MPSAQLGAVREGQNDAEPTRSPVSNLSIAATPVLQRDDAGGMSYSSSEDLRGQVERGPVDLTSVVKWADLTSDVAASRGGWESNFVNDKQPSSTHPASLPVLFYSF
jgi:hypothetical protein